MDRPPGSGGLELPQANRGFLSPGWLDGVLHAAWIAAGWKERMFWLSLASFMAAGSAHGFKDLLREIPVIQS